MGLNARVSAKIPRAVIPLLVRFRVRNLRCGPMLAMLSAMMAAPESAIAHDGKSRRVRELRTTFASRSDESGNVLPHRFNCVPCIAPAELLRSSAFLVLIILQLAPPSTHTARTNSC